MILVYYTSFEKEFEKEMWAHFSNQVPPDMLASILRYKRWQDRQAVLLGKLLLRKALIHKNLNPDLLYALKFTKYNRPYLELGFDFNISHSGAYVMCAVCGNGGVGTDIEQIKPIEFEHFNKIMSLGEWDEIHHAESPLSCFYKYWAIKESVIKADGRGLSIPLDQLTVKNGRVELDGKDWFIKNLALDPGYASYLAYNEDQEIRIKPITLADLR